MPRVLVVENRSVLGAAVQSLLAGQTGLEVVGVAPRDYAELIVEIWRARPNVVVLHKVMGLADSSLFDFLQCFPKMRLVVVNENDNMARIYDKHQVMLTRAADLANLIGSSWH
jgi:chemotaxis response regulator CheB